MNFLRSTGLTDFFPVAPSRPPSSMVYIFTVVTGLDPTLRVLTDKYQEAVTRFLDIPFSSIDGALEEAFNILPNDWSMVESRLKERHIL